MRTVYSRPGRRKVVEVAYSRMVLTSRYRVHDRSGTRTRRRSEYRL